MSAFTIEPLGDEALLIRLGEKVEVAINARVHALATALHAAHLPGVHDVAPAYASVCVRYDLAAWMGHEQIPFDALRACVERLLSGVPSSSAAEDDKPIVEIPVCYGGDFGPDLEVVAAHSGLCADDVIAAHATGNYRVAMLGFAPGFAYLLGLDNRLHAPRRAQPRTLVPAGSVAIGGAQTGIYPRELPGGWQIIGRTNATLFDTTRATPALLAPGQRVRFVPVEAGTLSGEAR